MIDSTKTSEEYFHLQESVDNFNNALAILKEIKRKKPKGNLLSAAFQFALIEYSKPFKRSQGIFSNKLSIDDKHIPEKYLNLHKRIITTRDKYYAHSDVTIKEPSMFFDFYGNRRRILFSRNNIDGLMEYKNIDEIISMIEEELDFMNSLVINNEKGVIKKVEKELTEMENDF